MKGLKGPIGDQGPPGNIKYTVFNYKNTILRQKNEENVREAKHLRSGDLNIISVVVE